MTLNAISIGLFAMGSIFAVAWFVEANTVGRGFISTYLAPLAFGPLIASSFIRVWMLDETNRNKGITLRVPEIRYP